MDGQLMGANAWENTGLDRLLDRVIPVPSGFPKIMDRVGYYLWLQFIIRKKIASSTNQPSYAGFSSFAAA